MKTLNFALLCLLFSFLLTEEKFSQAQNVYRWTDEAGRVHYSSTPNANESQPAALPDLKRENIDERIRDLRQSVKETCNNHGGINCQAGADSDGSVICYDGYRESLSRFNFECLEARLLGVFYFSLDNEQRKEIKANVSLSVEELRKNKIEPRGLLLSIRNISGVTAKDVNVQFSLGKKHIYTATGPSEIPAFQNAEYSLSFSNLLPAPTLADLAKSRYKLVCANCGTVERILK